MAWFRANRGVVAWLAFFALACQLSFSFGHVHVGKFSGGSAAWAAADVGDVSNGDVSADTSPSPPQKNPAGLAGDFCAICANISLAGTLILPVLAIILALGLFIHVLRWSLAASEPAAFDRLPFTARGPPHA
jgi:hypothetical protein